MTKERMKYINLSDEKNGINTVVLWNPTVECRFRGGTAIEKYYSTSPPLKPTLHWTAMPSLYCATVRSSIEM